jgi:hypothetical protein
MGPEQRSTARTVTSEAADERATGLRTLSRSAEPEVAEQPVRPPKGRQGRGSRAPGTAGYATLGTLFSTLVGALGALAVSEFVERYLQDLAEMPLPPLDPRDTLTYLADPATQAGMQLFDMLGCDWRAAGLAVYRASDQMFAQTASGQNRLLLADRHPLPERLDDLAALMEEVGGIVTKLETIERNIDAILALEGQLEKTAAHAEALEPFVEKVLPAGIAAGVVPMHPEEAARVAQVLRHIKVGSRVVPVRIRALREVVAPLVIDWREGASELNSAYFRLAVEATISEASQRGTTNRFTGRTSSTEDVRGIK